MLTKQVVKEMVDNLPETFSVDDVVDELILLDKIQRAKKEIENGEGTDWEDVKKEMDKWFE